MIRVDRRAGRRYLGAAMRAYMKASAGVANVGLEVVVSIFMGFVGGWWLDGQFGTKPWLMAVGAVFGLVAAGRFIYRASKKVSDSLERDGFVASSTDRPARFALEQRHPYHFPGRKR